MAVVERHLPDSVRAPRRHRNARSETWSRARRTGSADPAPIGVARRTRGCDADSSSVGARPVPCRSAWAGTCRRGSAPSARNACRAPAWRARACTRAGSRSCVRARRRSARSPLALRPRPGATTAAPTRRARRWRRSRARGRCGDDPGVPWRRSSRSGSAPGEEAPLGPGISTRGGVACCYTRAPGKPGVVVTT